MAPHAFQSQPCQPSIIRSIPSLSFRQLAAFPLMHSWSACLLCAPDVDPTLTTFPDLALRCRLMRSLVRRSTALRRRREVSLAAAGAAARCGGGGGGAGGAGGGGGGCDASDFGTCNAAFASTRRSRHCTRLYTSRSASDRVRSCRGELQVSTEIKDKGQCLKVPDRSLLTTPVYNSRVYSIYSTTCTLVLHGADFGYQECCFAFKVNNSTLTLLPGRILDLFAYQECCYFAFKVIRSTLTLLCCRGGFCCLDTRSAVTCFVLLRLYSSTLTLLPGQILDPMPGVLFHFASKVIHSTLI